MKYVKKPVVIEAFQMTFERARSGADWPIWLNQAFDDGVAFWKDGYITIHTLEGDMYVGNGDFIIQGVKGELYPCKPDIFDYCYDELI